jgi:hypothetical protein
MAADRFSTVSNGLFVQTSPLNGSQAIFGMNRKPLKTVECIRCIATPLLKQGVNEISETALKN